jgi:FkbM family methyltransferase
MSGQRVKSALLRLIGERPTACLHALRFAYLLRVRPRLDPEVQLLSRWLRPGDVAVDVGANGADWTHSLHRHVGAKGHVYAFEADPYYALATHLTIRLLRLSGVTLFRFGLSDRNETVPLRITDTTGLRLSGLGYVDRSASTNTPGSEKVELRTLDSLTSTYPDLLRTGVLKCDVEGYELPVLRGAASVIAGAQPVVVFEVGCFEKQGYAARDLGQFLAGYGYRVFAVAQDNQLVAVDPDLGHPSARGVNRVAIPESRYETIRDLISG